MWFASVTYVLRATAILRMKIDKYVVILGIDRLENKRLDELRAVDHHPVIELQNTAAVRHARSAPVDSSSVDSSSGSIWQGACSSSNGGFRQGAGSSSGSIWQGACSSSSGSFR